MSKSLKIGLAIVAVLLALAIGVVGAIASLFNIFQSTSQSLCLPRSEGGSGVALQPVKAVVGVSEQFNSPEQQSIAQLVVGIGASRGRSPRDIKIALMTGMQESRLRNLKYGDRDSKGVFQQRPSQGWGTEAQVLDPVYATNTFYSRLERIEDRDALPLIVAAKRVQQPDDAAYNRSFDSWEPAADVILANYSGGQSGDGAAAPAAALPLADCVSLGGMSGSVEIVVQAALSQQGKPYRWGGSQDQTFFDCSQFTEWTYAQAGIKLPRTAAEQFAAGPAVPAPPAGTPDQWLGTLKRGDLLYWRSGPSLSRSAESISHVALYLGDGQMIDAPGSGKVVGVKPVYFSAGNLQFAGATRPIADNTSSGVLHTGWQWPVENHTITSPYGMRFHPIKKVLKLHDGTDFGVATGTPVRAANAGTVTSQWNDCTGTNVIIDHGGGVITKYQHLSQAVVTSGQVGSGTLIAYSGNTGSCSTGAHLHFMVEASGQPTNPVSYLRQFGLVP